MPEPNPDIEEAIRQASLALSEIPDDPYWLTDKPPEWTQQDDADKPSWLQPTPPNNKSR